MTRVSTRLFVLRATVVDAFFVFSQNAMHKSLLLLLLERLFASKQTPFKISWIQLAQDPISLFFPCI